MYVYNLELYKNHSDNNQLQKDLTDKHDITGASRVPVDILKPVMDLKGFDATEYNYCYIRECKRFYFIENTVVAPNGIYTLSMRVDVLMSYVADIQASRGLITKQRDYNPYYGEYDVEARTTLEQLQYPDLFNHTGEFVLVALRH